MSLPLNNGLIISLLLQCFSISSSFFDSVIMKASFEPVSILNQIFVSNSSKVVLFPFILKQNKKWALAPAYDICFAYKPKSFWVSQHALSLNGKRKGFTLNDLLTVAKSMNIKKAKTIINEVQLQVLS